VPSLRWLRRLAHSPAIVSGYEGIEDKPLRDCTDEEVRAIVAFHSQRGSRHPELERLFDEDWWLRTMLELREQDRNPLEGEGFFSLLGFAWSRLVLKAARRSSAVRWLFRLRGRIEDRLRRDDDADDWIGEEGDDDQIAFGGSALNAIHQGRGNAQ
jgi:hypothetical protein